MRIAYHYGLLAGGGVERRLADLYRHLTRRGDDVWIIGLRLDSTGRELLCWQGGVPEDRIIIAPPATQFDNTFHLWSWDTLEELQPDIIDCQWCASPYKFPLPAVATVHGFIPMPPADVFQGILFIADFITMPTPGQRGPIRAIENWVDLGVNPFHEDLPREGICCLGREYKAANAEKVARAMPDTNIDCYTDAWTPDAHPDNMIYQGYGNPPKVYPEYRIVFAAALAAMEAIAAGRLVIAGQPAQFMRSDYRLVTPARMEEMARTLFSFNQTPKAAEPTPKQCIEEFGLAVAMDDCLKDRKAMRNYLARYHNAKTQIGLVRDFYEEVLAG